MKAEQIAAFVDRQLSGAERLGVEAHLADCSECRKEVVEVGRIMIGSSRRRRTSAGMLGGFAVAAGAVLVLTVARRPPEAPPDQLVRGGVTALVAVGPRGPVPRAGLTLVWFAAGPGAVYRITLSDISGKSVWTSDTRDTSVVVPTRIQLSPDTDYFWTVDATLSQGSSRTTTAQSFRVTR